ncbi:hypothetical protein [Bacteroides acidifaciens]|uniref:hypothetical protein n=1 Tax=Bacteroides acidifaciens TaxID=85831 RepID=UPI0025B424DE|nr:hypothetical protein [Bacteroides acidifaciens]
MHHKMGLHEALTVPRPARPSSTPTSTEARSLQQTARAQCSTMRNAISGAI